MFSTSRKVSVRLGETFQEVGCSNESWTANTPVEKTSFPAHAARSIPSRIPCSRPRWVAMTVRFASPGS